MIKILLVSLGILAAILLLVFIWPQKPEDKDQEPGKTSK